MVRTVVVVEKVTISALRYGECRNSTGTLGTDRLFTGQRLDDTGLYYYGARYYDPTIGRFISPDTIVQTPNNPQSLNRYSYVFNNPLRYTDPSGLIVEFENEDYIMDLLENDEYIAPGSPLDEMIQEWAELVLAWEEFGESSPEIANYLDNVEDIVNIQFGDTDGSGATTSGYMNGEINVTVGNEYMNYTQIVSSYLGHESVHVIARLVDHVENGWEADSIFEEALAFKMENSVSNKIGCPVMKYENTSFDSVMKSRFGDPALTAVLLDIANDWEIRKDYHNYYNLNVLPNSNAFYALQKQVVASFRKY
ncbi:MAG: RHS repeat-associated core domain-containing protein [Dehalococcoidales bacterium]|nr:RHS repeat-associated core domain-containing protein [Dehalococcoidales bacterium]